MKLERHIVILAIATLASCSNLDLDPLAEGSGNTWYSDETEINMAINDLYRRDFWPKDADEWTDDWLYRETLTPITNGTLGGDWSTSGDWWGKTYKAISRANTLLGNLEEISSGISEEKLAQYKAEARFVRASQYALLISHWGDVVYFDQTLTLEEAFSLGKTPKAEILTKVYEDYDFAAANLPQNYGSNENQRATKGAAFALKARIALYMGDYTTAKAAAQSCIDLNQYSLYPDFGKLFLSSTKNSVETIFALPQSVELNISFNDCQNYIPRNTGGWGAKCPSWDLFSAFLCDDGLPIDESPLYNPRKPFENRDPRCAASIIEFQTEHLGYMYQPHPDSLQCWSFENNAYVKNNDTRSNAQFASYNGLLWKKGIDADWDGDYKADPDIVIIRLADVLLMYAEAKVELNEIDDSVLEAINRVRARAYQADVRDVAAYPEITTTNQTELRRIIRLERRMEFALEGVRYMDIIRWKLAEKVLNLPNYGMLDPAELRTKVVQPGLWFFPAIPEIDDEGIADFSAMFNAGLIKRITTRNFSSDRQYLWPIPNKEILINDRLENNPNY